ncbi:hybrid sensor histidine kinase/response regulator [Ancylobacter defluvii]|uniref:Chemotaxis protein CheA n=1 Tax=Ancylobacter defluvii TaxID=1282440 RepID=A0A9W6JUY5_9HYPH|nr:hybrid sensor histidine kinase/response regulator [Ancylobacter defluvii]MBS7586128.1 hybrid sensor histidine kinase/response regulator [Ancylobacter defluvii]GLK82324.1 hybrid sensor histidine kinase/response regulator [Ancylobacter defluvii]
MSTPDYGSFSMLDLFRAELDMQSQALTNSLLALERDPVAAAELEAAMRAAHSLKGAARIVELMPAVQVAHAMEECLVAAQNGQLRLRQGHIDALLKGVDLLALVATDEAAGAAAGPRITAFLHTLEAASTAGGGDGVDEPTPPEPEPALATLVADAAPPTAPLPPPDASSIGADRMIRITSQSMTRLLGLAGESLIEARRLRPFADSLQRLRRQQAELARALDTVRAGLPPDAEEGPAAQALALARATLGESRDYLATRLAELDSIDRRGTDLANRLYAETLESRMRPFEDGVRSYSRTVRDLSRALGKQARLAILGGATGIDRDILDQLDAPLGHLLRNAIDHGLETPEERRAAGKPAEGLIRLEARHTAGLLQIIIADDGRGIDLDGLRRAVVERHLIAADAAARLSEAELLEFLFLPGFSMKPTVSDVSGRGVGLDAVQTTVKEVRGRVSVTTRAGEGTRFLLELPLTLSVIRTLLVEVDGEPYALPLAGITRTLKLARDAIETLEGRPHFRFGARPVGLITAHELLERGAARSDSAELAVVVIGEDDGAYGLIVDRFLGERELVVRLLDPRLGKIKDISAAALMEDGAPVLIVDMDDLLQSADKLAMAGAFRTLRQSLAATAQTRRKRVLVVDDSLTVRELERKLLDQHGYAVEIAVDGMDGWNAVRSGAFDLVVTDVDMPRMDGIELVTLIKHDPRLNRLPVMIVSYKDREEDRRRGLDAGADYYLTKGSFHDETLIHAVEDLIGAAVE